MLLDFSVYIAVGVKFIYCWFSVWYFLFLIFFYKKIIFDGTLALVESIGGSVCTEKIAVFKGLDICPKINSGRPADPLALISTAAVKAVVEGVATALLLIPPCHPIEGNIDFLVFM